MSPERRRRHHFRPVLHLRHFAKDGRLWIYDRRNPGTPRQAPPKEVAREAFLYAPGDGQDPRDDRVELWLAREIDAAAAAPLASLVGGTLPDTLDSRARSHVANYIAAQDLRTPTARDLYLTLYKARLNEQWAELTKDPAAGRAAILAQSGVELTEQAFAALAASYELVPNKGTWLDFITRSVNDAGKRIFTMGWTLVRARDSHDFITNDIGIVKCRGEFDQFEPYTIGWLSGCDHWIVPLGSRVALTLTPENPHHAAVGRPWWIRAVNRRVVLDASRFVYSRSRHAFVASFWQQSERGTF